MSVRNLLSGLMLLVPVLVSASEPGFPDQLELTKVSDRVYSAIGETGPGTYENHGHNNNLSFIIAEEGVVVMNGGDNYLLALSLIHI